MFTKEELASLLALINRTNLQGNEAVTVALLIQKINGLLADNKDKQGTKEIPDGKK